VAILDADKEGFLRSAGSLIQTVGRAGRAMWHGARRFMYADTDDRFRWRNAIGETDRRRARSRWRTTRNTAINPRVDRQEHRRGHVERLRARILRDPSRLRADEAGKSRPRREARRVHRRRCSTSMKAAATNLEFEEGRDLIRDRIKQLKKPRAGAWAGRPPLAWPSSWRDLGEGRCPRGSGIRPPDRQGRPAR